MYFRTNTEQEKSWPYSRVISSRWPSTSNSNHSKSKQVISQLLQNQKWHLFTFARNKNLNTKKENVHGITSRKNSNVDHRMSGPRCIQHDFVDLCGLTTIWIQNQEYFLYVLWWSQSVLLQCQPRRRSKWSASLVLEGIGILIIQKWHLRSVSLNFGFHLSLSCWIFWTQLFSRYFFTCFLISNQACFKSNKRCLFFILTKFSNFCATNFSIANFSWCASIQTMAGKTTCPNFDLFKSVSKIQKWPPLKKKFSGFCQ